MDKSQFIPTLYDPGFKQEILQLLHAASYKSSLWDWQFESSPFSLSFNPVVIKYNGEIVGFNGVMPVKVKYLGREIEAIWSCDFYVDARFRGQGLGKLIKKELHTSSNLIMTFGVSDDAARVLNKIGWNLSPNVFTYRKIKTIHSLRELSLQVLQIINLFKGLKRRCKLNSVFLWMDNLPDINEVNSLWENVCYDYKKTVVRNYAYLSWKYEFHPLAKYKFLTVRDNQNCLQAILIIRDKNKLLRIVDYLGPAQNYLIKRALLQKVINTYSKYGFVVTTTDIEFGLSLCDLGGFKSRTQPRFFIHSELLNDDNPADGWFIMSGDSDGEILTASADVEL